MRAEILGLDTLLVWPLLGIALLLLPACSATDAPEGSYAPLFKSMELEGHKRHQATTWDGHHQIDFLLPDPIPLNAEFTIVGKVDSMTDLSVGATMPHHGHGTVREPVTTHEEDGTFQVTGMLFHMPGRWELIFDVEQRFRTERAQVPIQVE